MTLEDGLQSGSKMDPELVYTDEVSQVIVKMSTLQREEYGSMVSGNQDSKHMLMFSGRTGVPLTES